MYEYSANELDNELDNNDYEEQQLSSFKASKKQESQKSPKRNDFESN